MVNKLFKSMFAVAMVVGSALGFVACETEGDEPVGYPTVDVSTTSLNFSNQEDSKSVQVTANADWKVAVEYVTGSDWVTVTPPAGKGDGVITVSVPINDTGAVREATIKVIALHPTYGDFDTKRIRVSQSADQNVTVDEEMVYGDNFDGKEATKTYGSGSSWPFIDQFPEFANPEGPAAENVTYTGSGVSVRANSTSNSNYSDYAGSGLNNIFFGANAYFQVNGISLDDAQQSYKLTFGTEKYTQDGDSTFSTEEFKVYLSKNGTAWEQIEFDFAGTEPGRWNVATANFTLTEVPETLYIKFTASMASVYRLDDVMLYTGNGGQQITLPTEGDDPDVPTPPTTDALYYDNFDGKVAQQEGSYWPYVTDFPEMKNAAGPASANVSYSGTNVTVRANSASNGTYSDYAGSGSNNIFFGKVENYFVISGLELESNQKNLQLTFGTEKYSQQNGSTFTPSEFIVSLSNDGQTWHSIEYTFAGTADGRWNVATADFTLVEVPSTLYIKFSATSPSSYRLDDVTLDTGNGGQSVDLGEEPEPTPDPTPDPNPEPSDVSNIADVLALNQGATINGSIEGIVVSNMELNNLTSKKGMYVQDETGALQFYLSANHEFAFGTKVRIDLTGATLGQYNGAVQISSLGLDKISVVSTGNSVTPKSVTMADFLANKYEGQYIAIEGVQVAAADLAKTWVMGGSHTSIAMENAEGQSFVVFSSKYATYGAETVAQGSGTIKGISSINNGVMQIIFAQASDYAGLTGERFDATENPEPTPDPTPDPTPEPDGVVKATVAQFLAAAEDDTIYELTGVINSVANTTYGNFYLKDDTGEVYIYGLCSPEGEEKYWAESGVKVGDTITVRTVRTSYNGTPQGKNAIYVSHVSVEVEEPVVPEGSTMATIVFSEKGYENAKDVNNQTIAIDENVSVVFSQGSANNPPAYYDAGQAIRLYQNGAVMNISANGKTITNIEITFANNHYYIAPDSGEFSAEASVRTWTGEASAVKFTTTGTDKNHRAYVAAIKVTYKN